MTMMENGDDATFPSNEMTEEEAIWRRNIEHQNHNWFLSRRLKRQHGHEVQMAANRDAANSNMVERVYEAESSLAQQRLDGKYNLAKQRSDAKSARAAGKYAAESKMASDKEAANIDFMRAQTTSRLQILEKEIEQRSKAASSLVHEKTKIMEKKMEMRERDARVKERELKMKEQEIGMELYKVKQKYLYRFGFCVALVVSLSVCIVLLKALGFW